MSSNARISDLIDPLKNKGHLHVVPFNYSTLTAFLSGYDMARTMAGATSELKMFAKWLDGRVGYHCSKAWSAVVRDVFANGDEEQAIPVLFDLLLEFTNDRVEE